MKLIGGIFVYTLIYSQMVICVLAHSTLEEAQQINPSPAKKYRKKLRKEEGALRLVGGTNDFEGNVEILHDLKWGNICDDEWDQNEGQVICRQLGFIGLEKITHSGYFGMARRRFWMDNIYCDGNETEIKHCRFDGWGKNDCEASEAAGVVCKGSKGETTNTTHAMKLKKASKHLLNRKYDIELRLTGGHNRYEGQVEIRFNTVMKKGHWGGICGDGWSLLEANVVCKSLNLGYASNALHTDLFSNNTLSKILISGTECYGNETSLQDCHHHELGNILCPGDQSKVAAVICSEKIADLIFDHHEFSQSAHLEDRPLLLLQCAMEENCLASRAYEIQRDTNDWHMETRRLLKFTARTLNAGTADFRSNIPKHLWEWHLCHQHYHSMEVFATFYIYNSTGHRVAEGHKASFCLEDNQCLDDIQPRYACANFGDQDRVQKKRCQFAMPSLKPLGKLFIIYERWNRFKCLLNMLVYEYHKILSQYDIQGQRWLCIYDHGISVNCSDIYRFNIDCQWVDITEMETGTYTIKISVNPEFKIGEMSYDNNAARCTLLYTETYARIFDCKHERP